MNPNVVKNVLFITHKKKQCGVYEFGNGVYEAIKASKIFNFIKVECNSFDELYLSIRQDTPIAIIYNYHPNTMPWIITRGYRGIIKNNLDKIPILQIGIIHEITQKIADTAVPSKRLDHCYRCESILNSLFDYYIAADPTLLLKNPFVFKTGRLIPNYKNVLLPPNSITIGSLGFGTINKGFKKVVQLVQKEFDNAEIHINIPYAEFGDKEGIKAREYADVCKKELYKPGIKLTTTHEFWNREELLDFLASNSINVFLYEDKSNRGISSALDNALAVDRPIAISDSIMFRHVLEIEPSVCIEKKSLKDIIRNGVTPLKKFKDEWTSENLLWDYERILSRCLQSFSIKSYSKIQIKKEFIKSILRKFKSSPEFNTWLRTTEWLYEDDYRNCQICADYNPIELSTDFSLNRILDNKTSSIYKSAIDKLFELVPKTMSKKIPAANVNQGFVFDTVYRFIDNYKAPKILCVGAYEDTACMALIKMGHYIQEIDPMINYTLQEFVTKPTTQKNSYDIIFSTSVIEHDPDDKSFVECVSELLSPGGIFIMTCDFRDDWKQGEPKPKVDVRLYTQNDLQVRLLSHMKNCEFIDTPDWSCSDYDFEFEGMRYTFASFAVKKKS